ncbi:hypothetical protein ACLB1T_33100 [Escherichia coli]
MEISFTRAAAGRPGALSLIWRLKNHNPPKPTLHPVTVLEGKTMGTFWRASIPGIDANAVPNLKKRFRPQLDADDQLLSTYKKDLWR